MDDNIAIKLDHVSKTFKLPHEKQSSIKGLIINRFKGGKRSYEQQNVLDDVSFEIKQGEFFGIVGRNGSGKSTLLKMLAGIYMPSKGDIQIEGKLTPFIELGVGFSPELTGRENVFLNGALLGFNRTEMFEMYEDIVSFAELEKFMDQKLKNYSSGMQVRLAFSIAIRAQSDILVLDEVLAVGDAIFQQKCFDYFKELKGQNKTVVLVSHDAGALQKYCDRGVLIESGKMRLIGPIQDVLNEYQNILVAHEEGSQTIDSTQQEINNKDVAIKSAIISNNSGKIQKVYTDEDVVIDVSVEYIANKNTPSPTYGVIVSDMSGVQIFASNTQWQKTLAPDIKKGETQVIKWRIPNMFNTGTYLVSPAVANNSGALMYDWKDKMTEFKVRKSLQSSAQTNIAHELLVQPLNGKES